MQTTSENCLPFKTPFENISQILKKYELWDYAGLQSSRNLFPLQVYT